MKKVRLLTLAAIGLLGLTACGGNNNPSTEPSQNPSVNPSVEPSVEPSVSSEENPYASLKVGLILLHPAASSTYDKNFREAFEAAQTKLGFEAIIAENIDENEECQAKAEEMARQGCDVVFADSFGHEDYMIEAARNYPNTWFCHATGTQAAAENLPNFFNAFAAIYEGRYLAGVAAGLKLKELYGDQDGNVTDANAKMGYVAAHPYAEVISGYTSFFLGAKSVVENVTMDVTYTHSWYDEQLEKTAAELLISRNVKLISQHADSYGAPNACESAGIPNVSYNGSTKSQCPNTFIVSSKINWQPYYEHVLDCFLNDTELEKDYVGTIGTGSVELTQLGDHAAAGTENALINVALELAGGTRHVFDVDTFTVGGAEPSEENCAPNKTYTYDYPEGTLFLAGGYYNESTYRSAPSFDIIIDGITEIDN